MSDLISRQALQDKLKDLSDMYTLEEEARVVLEAIVKIVTEQPTAYDIEKVVAELESKRDCRELTNYYGDVIGVRNIDTIKIDKAIDIARKGGVE